MQQSELVKISFPAGIISPGYLLQILEVLSRVQVSEVRFGARQQLLIDVPKNNYAGFASLCAERQIKFSDRKDLRENLVSSYAAAGIFVNDSWLGESAYKEVFDLFDYSHRLKINVNDAGQTFVPLFTGHVNWVAAPETHFWYLYIRLPQTNTTFRWPGLIYTNNMGSISLLLEKLILDEKLTRQEELVERVKKELNYIHRPIEKDLELPRFHLPYYEGFNQHGAGSWLGIYRRNEFFSVAFLKDLCTICLQTRVSELYATSWKTIIIKGIEKKDRSLWDHVLGKHRINVRHAANELNWLIEDDCEDGLILKRHVIRYFDKEDVRTYGLCFSIKTKNRSGQFGSVVIRREEIKNPNRLKSMERFSILYTAGFNPNSGQLHLFRSQVEKDYLGPYLVALCKQFYEQENQVRIQPLPPERSKSADEGKHDVEHYVYQCRNCMSVYDEKTGEPETIPAGTSFESLPVDYGCPVCGTPASGFLRISESRLYSTMG